MARTTHREPKIHLKPVFERMGPQKAVEEIARIIAELESDQQKIDIRPFLKLLGLKRFWESLTEAQRQQLLREMRRES